MIARKATWYAGAAGRGHVNKLLYMAIEDETAQFDYVR